MLFAFCYGKQELVAVELIGKSVAFFVKDVYSSRVEGVLSYLIDELTKSQLKFRFETNGGAEDHSIKWHKNSDHIRYLGHYHLEFDHDIDMVSFKKNYTTYQCLSIK